MTRVLIIGYGSPLRGDDAFGWHAAHQLLKSPHHSLQVLAAHQLTPELAEPISQADLVIFIDASKEGEPGTWKCEDITEEQPLVNPLAHQFAPAILLAYARTIFRASPTAIIVSFATDSFVCSQTLTPGAEAALAEVLQWISERLACNWRLGV
jgi:hydrogenase maturation protease